MFASIRESSSERWSTPAILPGGPGDFPSIAGNSGGDFLVAFAASDGGGARVQSSTFVATSGRWAAPEPLSLAGGTAFQQRVAATNRGDGLVVYIRWDGSNYRVQAVVKQ